MTQFQADRIAESVQHELWALGYRSNPQLMTQCGLILMMAPGVRAVLSAGWAIGSAGPRISLAQARTLAIALDGLRPEGARPLPGPAPSAHTQAARWRAARRAPDTGSA